MSSPAQNPGAPSPKKRKKYHLAPALAIGALIAVMALLYFGMRSARVPAELPTQQRLGLTIPVPEGWKLAAQRSPSGADGRVALGAPASRRQAMFITRYRLQKEVKDPSSQAGQLRRSLASTGGPSSVSLTETKVAGNKGLEGSFKAAGLRITTWVFFSGRSSWQLSCQSMPGNGGKGTRERCQQIVDQLKVG